MMIITCIQMILIVGVLLVPGRFWRGVFKQGVLLELGAVGVLWLAFVALVLFPVSAPTHSGAGVEYERLTGLLIPARVGLSEGFLPTWNPYMGRGEPLLGNAFNYLFNPLTGGPVLLFGAVQGAKVGLALSLLAAAVGAWSLARVIGTGTVARVWVGAMWMMSGGIAGKVHPGHYQLATSLCLVPGVLAAFWWTLHSPRRWAPLAAGALFALLFFAGNIWYVLPTLVICAMIAALHLVERESSGTAGAVRWRWRADRLKRIGLAALFGMGLAGVQFFPIWFVRGSVAHVGAVDFNLTPPRLIGQYGYDVALLNFFTPFASWVNLSEHLPTTPYGRLLLAVDYSYIGIGSGVLVAAAAGLALLRPGLVRVPQRGLALSAALIVLMMTWGAAQTPLLEWLYVHVPLLDEFRFLGRAQALAALGWLLLAGLCLDLLWRVARGALPDRPMAEALTRSMVTGIVIGLSVVLYSAQTDEVRLALWGGSTLLRDLADPLRLTTYFTIARALWGAALLPAALWLIVMALRAPGQGVPVERVLRRAAALGLLTLALLPLWDVMQNNSLGYWFDERNWDYGPLYAIMRERDPGDPFPSVHEPDTQSLMFQNYHAGVRNAWLNEGWVPLPITGLNAWPRAFVGDPETPTWTITLSGENPVIGPGHTLVAQQCVEVEGALLVIPVLDAPCDSTGRLAGALWRYERSLPYAFLVRGDALLGITPLDAPGALIPATVEQHALDTITLTANVPPEASEALPPPERQPYTLVVQEVNFPGWRAERDGVPLLPQTANVFVALPTVPGTHTYVLRYQPPGLGVGVMVTALTLIAGVFYLLGPVRR